jgi:hypothetical protein
MSLSYRKVDTLLSADAGGEVRPGDTLLLEDDRIPRGGELVLVRRGAVEAVCRWDGAGDGEVVGVVIGIKRRP